MEQADVHDAVEARVGEGNVERRALEEADVGVEALVFDGVVAALDDVGVVLEADGAEAEVGEIEEQLAAPGAEVEHERSLRNVERELVRATVVGDVRPVVGAGAVGLREESVLWCVRHVHSVYTIG